MKLFSVVLASAILISTGNYLFAQGTYIGSGSVTHGLATTTTANLFPGCAGARVSAVGTITSTDGKVWTVPAQTDFATGPYLPDLYNQCSGVMPASITVTGNELRFTAPIFAGITPLHWLYKSGK